MLLIVELDHGGEEGYDVPENTKLLELLNDGYWVFTTLTGGQVALADGIVTRVTLGNVSLVLDLS